MFCPGALIFMEAVRPRDLHDASLPDDPLSLRTGGWLCRSDRQAERTMNTHDIPKGVFSILLPLCQTLSRAHIPAALLFPSLLLLDRGLSCNLFFNLSLSHSAVCAVLLPREQCRRAAGHLLAGRFLFRAVSLW